MPDATPNQQRNRATSFREATAGVLLGLATAAKLFPVILAPLVFARLLADRTPKALRFGAIYVLVTLLALSPLLLESEALRSGLGLSPLRQDSRASKEGIAGFFSHWRMNDVAFSFVYENARADGKRTGPRPWFVVLPDTVRAKIESTVRQLPTGLSPPFCRGTNGHALDPRTYLPADSLADLLPTC